MAKNSFTLLETLLSITLLLIVVVWFKNISYHDFSDSKDFMNLNDIENSFDAKNYSNFSTYSKNIIVFKDKQEETINVKVYEYEDENIRLFKYEK